ncbi:hypothetical protein OAT67_01085 [Bacteriovoracaceae bacterium]|nr:hypothetical protein [Bacteriovoracaceae bacterium]
MFNLVYNFNHIFNFRGPMPALSLIWKLFRDIRLPKGVSEIYHLTWKEIKALNEYHNQEVKENEAADKKLLKASTLSYYPKEVCQITLINSQNEIIESKIYRGSMRGYLPTQNFKKAMANLILKARQRGITIEEVVISHTHPSIEVLAMKDDGEGIYIKNGLSEADIKFGQHIAEFSPYPVRIKAITPAANYSMIF